MVRPRADDARKTQQELTVPDSVSESREGSYSSPLALLPATLDAVSDGLVIVDAEGCCRYLNEAAATTLGQSAGALLGQPVWSHLPNDLGRRLREACESATAAARPSRLTEHQPDLGGWLEIRVFPHGGDTMLVFRDRNAEQLADDELAEEVESISEAERIVGFGMWRWEIASGRVRWSDELHRIYGLRPGEFGGTVEASWPSSTPKTATACGPTSRARWTRWRRSSSRRGSCGPTVRCGCCCPRGGCSPGPTALPWPWSGCATTSASGPASSARSARASGVCARSWITRRRSSPSRICPAAT